MTAKHKLFREVTDAAVNALGVRPEQVRIVLREISEGHYSVGGKPLTNVFGASQSIEESGSQEVVE